MPTLPALRLAGAGGEASVTLYGPMSKNLSASGVEGSGIGLALTKQLVEAIGRP